ncbi:dTDP-4-dehydrorhamnose reductase [Jeongeupia sp. USM3]|nr:dTDP-4-dehydrorhamnose reductase [Jeongeupia sp. USM3]
MRIVLFGAGGQLGHALRLVLAPLGELHALDRDGCDVADAAAVRRVLARLRPDVIVNAAAYTAVDRAEHDEAQAFAVNAAAPAAMAAWAAGTQALLLHYSSDYVFDGRQASPYAETDAARPLSVYGRSKLAGDLAITASGCRHLVLRSGWIYSAHGVNFVTTILRLGRERDVLRVVDDQIGTPTSARLIAAVSAELLRRHQVGPAPLGVYHVSAGGGTSWFGFAREILAQAERLVPGAGWARVEAIASSAYPQAAQRPADSRLDTARFRAAFGTDLPCWQADVGACVAQVLA